MKARKILDGSCYPMAHKSEPSLPGHLHPTPAEGEQRLEEIDEEEVEDLKQNPETKIPDGSNCPMALWSAAKSHGLELNMRLRTEESN